jgi:hypothetical protein
LESEAASPSFSTSTLDGDVSSASRPGRFSPGTREKGLVWFQNRRVRFEGGKTLTLPRIELGVAELVSCLYIAGAQFISVHTTYFDSIINVVWVYNAEGLPFVPTYVYT